MIINTSFSSETQYLFFILTLQYNYKGDAVCFKGNYSACFIDIMLKHSSRKCAPCPLQHNCNDRSFKHPINIIWCMHGTNCSMQPTVTVCCTLQQLGVHQAGQLRIIYFSELTPESNCCNDTKSVTVQATTEFPHCASRKKLCFTEVLRWDELVCWPFSLLCVYPLWLQILLNSDQKCVNAATGWGLLLIQWWVEDGRQINKECF